MDDLFLIGQRDGIGEGVRIVPKFFGITDKDRERHLYCAGKTGTGKSTLLDNLLLQDIHSGKGFALIDPHGDLSDKVLDSIPKHRIKDVVYFSPTDLEYPIGLNFFSMVEPDQRYLIVEHILSVFIHVWNLDNEFAPRLLNLLRNTISALLEKRGSTLNDVYTMLTDESFRNDVVSGVKDSQTRKYWDLEFGKYDPRERGIVISSTLSRVGALLSSPMIRNSVGQVKNKMNFTDITNKNKILICNLPKGLIGEEGSKLFGALISIKLYLTIMKRAEIPEEERVPFYLYVDEFQNFSNSVYKDILSESRKYKLSLTLANQYISQLSPNVRAAIFGNVGSIVSFQVGVDDAEHLAKEFSNSDGILPSHIFTGLSPYEIRARLQVNGSLQTSFNARTLPPHSYSEGNRKQIISRSRFRYSRERDVVEAALEYRWKTKPNKIKGYSQASISVQKNSMPASKKEDTRAVSEKDIDDWKKELVDNFRINKNP